MPARFGGRAAALVLAASLAAGLTLSACSSGGSDADSDDTFTAAPGSLGARYLAIAKPANEKLDHSFDALEDDEHDNLKGAQQDLRDTATVERAFDKSLLAISWPAAVEATARSMVSANEARADISVQAAASTTLAQIATFVDQDLAVANGVVERWVDQIRQQLDLPPPDTS